jgi:hypothetical protein
MSDVNHEIVAASVCRPDEDNRRAFVIFVTHDPADDPYEVWVVRMVSGAMETLNYFETVAVPSVGGFREWIGDTVNPSNIGTVMSISSAIKLGYRAVGNLLDGPSYSGWREVYFGHRSFAVLTGKVAAPDVSDNPVIGDVPKVEEPRIFSGTDDDFASRRKRRRKTRKAYESISEASEEPENLVNVYHPATSSEIETGTVLVGRAYDSTLDMRTAPALMRAELAERGKIKDGIVATMVQSGTTRSVIKLIGDNDYERCVNQAQVVAWAFVEDGSLYYVGNSSLMLDGKPVPSTPRPVYPELGYPDRPGKETAVSVRRKYATPPHLKEFDLPPFDPACEFMMHRATDTKHGGKWYCVRLIALLVKGKVAGAYEVSISHGRYGSPNFSRKSADVFHDLDAARAAFNNRVRAKTGTGGYYAVDTLKTPWFNR